MVALGAVDDRVARAEGESYRTAVGWRSAHERFWREEVFPDWDGEVPVLDDSTPIVVEWFRIRERSSTECGRRALPPGCGRRTATHG